MSFELTSTADKKVLPDVSLGPFRAWALRRAEGPAEWAIAYVTLFALHDMLTGCRDVRSWQSRKDLVKAARCGCAKSVHAA